MNYLYIDDPPHRNQKMIRAFKAFESSNSYIGEISMARSDHLDGGNLENLINFIKEYIRQFIIEANGTSHIKSFHMELMRMINYLGRFGLLIYRNNEFQNDDMHSIFSFL